MSLNLGEETNFTKVLILDKVLNVSFRFFVNNCHFSRNYEEYILAELSLYDAVVIDCINPFLQYETEVAQEFDREPSKYIYWLKDATIEVDNNLSSEVIIKQC